jgi:branched-chain amino acid transport system substrate-binding protein
LKPKFKSLAAIAVVLVTGTIGFSAAGAATRSTSTPFTVLAINDKSGPQGLIGVTLVDGMKAAAKVINAKGGILGHKVTITSIDDQGDTQTGLTALTSYLSSHGQPNMVTNGYVPAEQLAELPILTRNKIITISNGDQLPDVPSKFPYIFGTNPSTSSEMQAVVNHAKAAGVKKLVLLSENTAQGTAYATPLQKFAKADGIATSVIPYDDSSTDLTPELQQAKADDPDGLVLEGVAAPCGYLLSARQLVGLTNVPTWITDGCGANGAPSSFATPAQLNKVTLDAFTAGILSSHPDNAEETFIHALASEGALSKMATPGEVASLSYDGLISVYQAATQAKSLSAAAITSALEKLKTPKQPLWTVTSPPGYSSSVHWPNQPSSWTLIPATTPEVNGFYQPGSSTSTTTTTSS